MNVTTNKAKGGGVMAAVGLIVSALLTPYIPETLTGPELKPAVDLVIMAAVTGGFGYLGAYLPKYTVCHPAAVAIAAVLLLPGCESIRLGYDAGAETVATEGAEAADRFYSAGKWSVCQASPIGAVRRANGGSEEAAQAYADFCARNDRDDAVIGAPATNAP